jgi:hypothetical protein
VVDNATALPLVDSPTATQDGATGHETPASLEIPGGMADWVQAAPELLVVTIVPPPLTPSPTATQWFMSGHETPARVLAAGGAFCRRHVVPRSLEVTMIAAGEDGALPTAQQCVLSAHETPKSVPIPSGS